MPFQYIVWGNTGSHCMRYHVPIRNVECVWRVTRNANLLMSFSIYVIVYEQSLGFTNIIKHIYGDYLHSAKRVTFHTHSTLHRYVRYSLLS